MTTTSRIDKLRAAMERAGVRSVAIVPGANLRYLLGLTIHSSERLALAFVPYAGAVRVVLPELELPRAAAEAQTEAAFYTWNDGEGFQAALRRCAEELDLAGPLGVEHGAMRVFELRALEAAASIEALDATTVLAELRMSKDAVELRAIREAVAAVEQGLHAAIAAIEPGVTEREIADTWERAMLDAGSEGKAFDTIVASGPNSANPHHTVGERHLRHGDLVILDGGARSGGYISDITRTVAVGDIGDPARAMYEAVRQANEAGRRAVRPGVSGAEVDAATRAVIDAAGLGAYFMHRTGHGIGIETHEPPYVSSANHMPLPPGSTFSIEPGVYISGVGGVRIEDDVVLTERGGESLTSFERGLIVR